MLNFTFFLLLNPTPRFLRVYLSIDNHTLSSIRSFFPSPSTSCQYLLFPHRNISASPSIPWKIGHFQPINKYAWVPFLCRSLQSEAVDKPIIQPMTWEWSLCSCAVAGSRQQQPSNGHMMGSQRFSSNLGRGPDPIWSMSIPEILFSLTLYSWCFFPPDIFSAVSHQRKLVQLVVGRQGDWPGDLFIYEEASGVVNIYWYV